MAASSSYCSPSSSAVTIPTPGKSILKRPPPPPQSLLSRFTKFLPAAAQSHPTPTSDDTKPLKRAHFILPELAIVYPISSVNPPSTPSLKDEKRAVEEREFERRRRVVRGNPSATGGEPEDWWVMDKVESFYRECCAGCDEEPDHAISAAFKKAGRSSPRTVDLSGIQLTLTASSVLSDVFTIEWGLRKLILRECDLDEHSIKPILHALLIPNSLSFLSIASNRRLKPPAFRLIGAYIKKADCLQFLDLSQNTLDKRSIELVVSGLKTPPETGLESLRLDECSLKPAALEALCRAVRTSSLKHISLRHNRISSSGGVALALMIRDYPDAIPLTSPSSSLTSPASPYPYPYSPSSTVSGTPASSTASSPASSFGHLPLPVVSPPTTPTITPGGLPSPNSNTHSKPGQVLPPPRHPPIGIQTTYTPYVPRSKRRPNALTGVSMASPISPSSEPTQPAVPIITSSAQGGITTRHISAGASGSGSVAGNGPGNGNGSAVGNNKYSAGPSAALLDRVRALDSLPRLGALRTLDLKGNDLRNGITYLAQVLKRNRTLKLLNLSDNKLDVSCLVAIAEALKYNSCLETLDMSRNPCSGPNLEGIQSLRTAFTLNTSLKRLFLSSTQLTSTGAIALAEFLPESTSLLHLDLTNNKLDIAGVMALSRGLEANKVMRCLDVNVPPGDEGFARMCREILNTCIRNTEEAERNSQLKAAGLGVAVTLSSDSSMSNMDNATVSPTKANAGTGVSTLSGRGSRRGVWGLIEESELARSIREGDEKKAENSVIGRAKACIMQLESIVSDSAAVGLINASNSTAEASTPTRKTQKIQETMTKAYAMIEELQTSIQVTEDPVKLEELLGVNDQLLALVKQISSTGQVRPQLTLQGLGLGLTFDTEHNGAKDGLKSASESQEAVDTEGEKAEEDEEVSTPTTPKIDKGKARAEPEVEEPEKVLSPSYVIDSDEAEDEVDDEEGYLAQELTAMMTSPTERSRNLVAEEAEIFRKGTVLLGPEELEGDYAGEELRKELLEAMVERPPPRPIHDDFTLDVLGGIDPIDTVVPPPRPNEGVSDSNPMEQTKPPPKPYIPRRTSSHGSASRSPSLLSPSASINGSVTSSPIISNGIDITAGPSPLTSPNVLAHVPKFVTKNGSTKSEDAT